MKTRNFAGKILIASVMLLSTSFLVSSCTKTDGNSSSLNYTLSGNASGSQMVPAVTGTGTGSITGIYDPNTNVMTYTTSWTNLSGAPTSGQLFFGTKGAVATAPVGQAWIYPLNTTNGGSIINSVTLSQDQATQLINGNYFYMIGTSARPNGEIRGQITATR